MLMHQTLSKGWCCAGSRLLPGLIVGPRGPLVEGRPLLRSAQSPKPAVSGLALRLGGHYAGDPLPMNGPASAASATSGVSLGCICANTSRTSVPRANSTGGGTRPRARSKGLALSPGEGTGRALGCIPRVGYHVLDTTCWIPRVGYHSHPGHREGEGFSHRVVLWAGDLPEEHFDD